MPPGGNALFFVLEHHQRFDQPGPGVFRENDLINIPQLGRFKRTGKVVSIIVDQLFSLGFRIFSLGDFLSEDDIDRSLRDP